MSKKRRTKPQNQAVRNHLVKKGQVMNALVGNPGTGSGTQSDNSIQRIYRGEGNHKYKEVKARLDALFPKDAILQQIITAPINDGLSEWRKASNELAEIEKALDYQRIFMEAGIKARLYGQALIVPVLDAGNSRRVALNRTADTAAKLGAQVKRLIVVDDFEESKELVKDTFSDYYKRPTYYTLNDVRVHHSRVIPVYANQTNTSVFEAVENSLSMFHLARIDVSRAVQEANFLVLKTDFEKLRVIVEDSNIVSGESEDLYDFIQKRLKNLRCNANNNNAYAIDKEFEEIVNVQKANIDDMVKATDQMAQFLAGDSDIPMSRLFAKSQTGLSNGSRADIENYIQALKGMRFMILQPALNELDRFIKLFNSSVSTNYEWNPISVERYLGETNASNE